MGLHIENLNRSARTHSVSEVGRRIRDARKAKELTQVQLAKLIGIDQSTLSDIERGAGFSADILMTLCDVLETPPELLMRGWSEATWPFPRIPISRFLALSHEDRAYVEGKLEAAIDSLQQPPPVKPSTFIPLAVPAKKVGRRKTG
jgi:transcriptional regulator with XRE-family HTH domain